MNPWKVSAQFAAYVWFSNRKSEKPISQEEAARFAEKNWIAFLPHAHEGLGQLLIKIAKPRRTTRHGRLQRKVTSTATTQPRESVVA
jgi:hypothetical protein